MTECYQTSIDFPSVKRRKVEADFSGGDISSNGGALLLRQVDCQLGLTRNVAKALSDQRRQTSCEFSLEELVKQRVYGLALGYEDLNERFLHDKLYWARGDMGNRIKDQQLGLFAHRTSSHRWWNNKFHRLLSGLTYVLFEGMRRLALQNTSLANTAPNTLRLLLLKIGAV